MRSRNLLLAGLAVLLVTAAAFFLLKRGRGPAGTLEDAADTTLHRGDSTFEVSGSLGRWQVQVTDSTTVLLNPGSEIGWASPQPEFWLDGDAFIEAPSALVVRTRELVLHCGSGAALRISAFAKDPGESAEVLRGQVRAEKAYPSPDHEPETLGPGNMVMINRDIDLMEKETFDTGGLRTWVDGTLTFDNMPFDSVVRRLEDWFGVTIEVKGEPSNARISGKFPQARLDQVMKLLATMLPMRYTIRKYTIQIVF